MFNVAIIGPGNIAHTYMHALADSKTVKITAVLGVSEETAKDFGEKYNISWYTDADVMYHTEKIDAVLVCTPTFTHEDTVKKAIENKVHIMCEKPFVLSEKTAQQLFDSAKAAGVRVMVMQVVRFWPQYQYIKNLVDSGKIGDITNVYVNRLSAHPNWCSWHKDPAKSGGGLYDLHIHDIDWLYYVFGKANSVYAVGKQTDTGCWNNVSTVIKFANGVCAVAEGFMDITGGWDFSTNVRINGTKSAVEYLSKKIDGNNGKESVNTLAVYPKQAEARVENVTKYDPYKVQAEYFAQCVTENKETAAVPETDVVYVLKMLKAIEKSLQTGLVQQIEE
ncbi:MAG: Gfo/Idh/MocA family oxidoreductase [Ruminococcaceae bacterium]|nr:Gfo/Idh/MocA family oxidoreductase [Oscillospiraceae bacterium]